MPFLLRSSAPRNIISGFRVTGIYPFDRNIFDEFTPSLVTDRDQPTDIIFPHVDDISDVGLKDIVAKPQTLRKRVGVTLFFL